MSEVEKKWNQLFQFQLSFINFLRRHKLNKKKKKIVQTKDIYRERERRTHRVSNRKRRLRRRTIRNWKEAEVFNSGVKKNYTQKRRFDWEIVTENMIGMKSEFEKWNWNGELNDFALKVEI